MTGGIVFYTHDKYIELNKKLFLAGELTEDFLNLSPDEYHALRKRMAGVEALALLYEKHHRRETWWKLNNELKELRTALMRYQVFQNILGDTWLFEETRMLTEQMSFFSDEEILPEEYDQEMLMELGTRFREDDEEAEMYYDPDLGEFVKAETEEQAPPDEALPMPLLVYHGGRDLKWRWYRQVIDYYQSFLHDISAFNQTIHNFINFIMSKLTVNSPENYAAALYDLYNDGRLYEKLVVNPVTYNNQSYSKYDNYKLSYVPRELPGKGFAICLEHATKSLQGLLKADFMLALQNGFHFQRCAVCGRYFLVKSGAHALYCEGTCPHSPRYTCRQFGTHEVQKELAKDIPKVRVKLTAFERITKDMRRGVISREEARIAKDYARDLLYEALRKKNHPVSKLEKDLLSENLYQACGIRRNAKPRGRPPKQKDGEAP